MCAKYQPETILAYAAAQQMTPADQQLIPQALELLRDKPLRNFRVDIAADSLVMLDENQNKQDRMQFLQAFGGFLAQALPVGQASPQMVPMMMELLRFGMQAFKAARPIEGQIDATLQQLQQAAQQQQPDTQAQGKQAELQQKGQVEQSRMQMESALQQAKLQQQMQMEQLKNQTKLQMEQQKQQFEAQLEAMRLQSEQAASKYKADMDAQTRLIIAQMNKAAPPLLNQ
jgi:F0F1-type ATP synthase membrane subunit b/b'